MVFELDDTSKAEALFEGWQETLIYSCLQKVMGKIYVTDEENPRSAMAFAGWRLSIRMATMVPTTSST